MSPTWEARFDLLDREIAARISAARRPASEVLCTWKRIVESSGLVTVRALVEETGWSQKHLISQFREHIGLAPKMFARVMRFGQRWIGSPQGTWEPHRAGSRLRLLRPGPLRSGLPRFCRRHADGITLYARQPRRLLVGVDKFRPRPGPPAPLRCGHETNHLSSLALQGRTRRAGVALPSVSV